MTAIAFLSDLHLTPEHTHVEQLIDFLHLAPSQYEALYCLGDLFEYWLDDQQQTDYPELVAALTEVATHIPCYWIAGNRDFLLSDRSVLGWGWKPLQDPAVIYWQDHALLLSHGDQWCINDLAYQRYRALSRNRCMQWLIQSLPYRLKTWIANQMRRISTRANHHKSLAIMDAPNDHVIHMAKMANTTWVIHGHTHRPCIHHQRDVTPHITRVVMGSWHTQPHVLIINHDMQASFHTLPLSP